MTGRRTAVSTPFTRDIGLSLRREFVAARGPGPLGDSIVSQASDKYGPRGSVSTASGEYYKTLRVKTVFKTGHTNTPAAYRVKELGRGTGVTNPATNLFVPLPSVAGIISASPSGASNQRCYSARCAAGSSRPTMHAPNRTYKPRVDAVGQRCDGRWPRSDAHLAPAGLGATVGGDQPGGIAA